jgi:uncharacterized RDD family membrane protein YckC
MGRASRPTTRRRPVPRRIHSRRPRLRLRSHLRVHRWAGPIRRAGSPHRHRQIRASPVGIPATSPRRHTSPLYGYGQPPEVPAGMYYDPSTELVLPNGTQLASHARRIGAWFLSIALFIVTLVIGYIVWGLIVWSRGQTPTYQVLGMRCWRPETKRVATWGWMALREVVGRLIEGAFGIVAVASFIMFLVLKQRRTIHDYIGGTVVVRDPNGVLTPQT